MAEEPDFLIRQSENRELMELSIDLSKGYQRENVPKRLLKNNEGILKQYM